jgi:hypothetical protein
MLRTRGGLFGLIPNEILWMILKMTIESEIERIWPYKIKCIFQMVAPPKHSTYKSYQTNAMMNNLSVSRRVRNLLRSKCWWSTNPTTVGFMYWSFNQKEQFSFCQPDKIRHGSLEG